MFFGQKWFFPEQAIRHWAPVKYYLFANRLRSRDFLLKGLDIPFLTPENKDVLKVYTPKEIETAGDIRKAIITYLNSLKK